MDIGEAAVKGMVCYLYILKSKSTDRYYIGSSINPDKRLKQHNIGNTRSTREKGPWELYFSQAFPTVRDARRIEIKLKSMKSREIIEQIIRDGRIKMQV